MDANIVQILKFLRDILPHILHKSHLFPGSGNSNSSCSAQCLSATDFLLCSVLLLEPFDICFVSVVITVDICRFSSKKWLSDDRKTAAAPIKQESGFCQQGKQR